MRRHVTAIGPLERSPRSCQRNRMRSAALLCRPAGATIAFPAGVVARTRAEAAGLAAPAEDIRDGELLPMARRCDPQAPRAEFGSCLPSRDPSMLLG